MRISTRGRYALRVMLDLARQGGEAFVPLKEVAARQEISQKYLEGIMAALSKAGLVEGAHGKGGGYRLCRLPEAYRVGEILCLTEGSLAPVACLGPGAKPCPRAAGCPTLPMWARLDRLLEDFFDGITLAELLEQSPGASPPTAPDARSPL
ncbi:MAG: RrF2 family transcriptional regulator [Oscillibacter sp.]|nr:RrF2 family transcriptional regulator [Oscillibacter sp.]